MDYYRVEEGLFVSYEIKDNVVVKTTFEKAEGQQNIPENLADEVFNSPKPTRIDSSQQILEGSYKSKEPEKHVENNLKLHCGKADKFLCDQCGLVSSSRSHLKRHYLVHTREKPFKCLVEGCGKAFSLKHNLLCHDRVHTGAKPFACTFESCKKIFTRAHNLRYHQMTCHNIYCKY